MKIKDIKQYGAEPSLKIEREDIEATEPEEIFVGLEIIDETKISFFAVHEK